MKLFLRVWIIITVYLSYEFIVIEKFSRYSLINYVATNLLHISSPINMNPGRSISYYFGWIGLGLMLTMNVYSIRKRLGFMRSWGALKNWLNFHIFCGLLGPTFILFHCGFKVRGLVGISFWSMVMSASSGVIGRYFYGQLSRSKKELGEDAEYLIKKINPELNKLSLNTESPEIKRHERHVLQFVGCASEDASPLSALLAAMGGDLRLFWKSTPRFKQLSSLNNGRWLRYGLIKRKIALFESFEKLMGYWHIFHTPFAFFMYIAAIIHVISAMIFIIK